MRTTSATEPGSPAVPNEDWVATAPGLIVVLDGATARTDTGCVHGVAWYAATLGTAITRLAADHDRPLGQVLADAIMLTAGTHPDCDLRHPATPSAAVAVVRVTTDAVRYLVLADTTVLIQTSGDLVMVTDPRVDSTAVTERAAADRHRFASPEKEAALLRMKHAELARRNRPGGFWVAAADPAVAGQAITGEVPRHLVRRIAVLTDGAARLVTMFREVDWAGLLDLLDGPGPGELIRRVRAHEAADPYGTRWPRNKPGDDATAVYARLAPTDPPGADRPAGGGPPRPESPAGQRRAPT